jgi:hypothetical protein
VVLKKFHSEDYLDSFLNVIGPAGIKGFVRTFQKVDLIAAHLTSFIAAGSNLRMRNLRTYKIP